MLSRQPIKFKRRPVVEEQVIMWKLVCSDNSILPILQGGAACCVNKNYDSRYQICCDGYVTYAGFMAKKKCCGNDVYTPGIDVCCNRNIRSTFGGETECCKDLNYNPFTHICCNEKILKLV